MFAIHWAGNKKGLGKVKSDAMTKAYREMVSSDPELARMHRFIFEASWSAFYTHSERPPAALLAESAGCPDPSPVSPPCPVLQGREKVGRGEAVKFAVQALCRAQELDSLDDLGPPAGSRPK